MPVMATDRLELSTTAAVASLVDVRAGSRARVAGGSDGDGGGGPGAAQALSGGNATNGTESILGVTYRLATRDAPRLSKLIVRMNVVLRA